MASRFRRMRDALLDAAALSDLPPPTPGRSWTPPDEVAAAEAAAAAAAAAIDNGNDDGNAAAADTVRPRTSAAARLVRAASAVMRRGGRRQGQPSTTDAAGGPSRGPARQPAVAATAATTTAATTTTTVAAAAAAPPPPRSQRPPCNCYRGSHGADLPPAAADSTLYPNHPLEYPIVGISVAPPDETDWPRCPRHPDQYSIIGVDHEEVHALQPPPWERPPPRALTMTTPAAAVASRPAGQPPGRRHRRQGGALVETERAATTAATVPRPTTRLAEQPPRPTTPPVERQPHRHQTAGAAESTRPGGWPAGEAAAAATTVPPRAASPPARGCVSQCLTGEAASEALAEAAAVAAAEAVVARATARAPTPALSTTSSGPSGDRLSWYSNPSVPTMRAGPLLVYPPLVVPVPRRSDVSTAPTINARLLAVMGGPSMVTTPAFLANVVLGAPPAAGTSTATTAGRAGTRDAGVDAEERGQWVVVRAWEVPRNALAAAPADVNGYTWECPLCVATWWFGSAASLRVHVQRRHGRAGVLACGGCSGGELFASYGQLVAHAVAVHGEDPRWRVEGEEEGEEAGGWGGSPLAV